MQKWTHRCCRILSSAYNQLTPPCSPGSHHQIHPPHRAWREALIYPAKYELSGGDGYIACRDEVLKLEVLQLRYAHSLTVFISTSSDLAHLDTITSGTFLPLPQGHTSAWERSDILQFPARMVSLSVDCFYKNQTNKVK